MPIHLIKLCVGCDTIEELCAWQAGRPDWRVHTRHTPKRAEELLDGGSLYRVFKGVILCRQRVIGVETVGEGAAKRCELILDPEVIRVAPAPRRPFQGWRYLPLDEAPADLPRGEDAQAMPPDLAARLRELGAW
jgi:hypothetical protein